jgi:glutamate/tyrosine decarboxylase-like PLP-dependent enzyme
VTGRASLPAVGLDRPDLLRALERFRQDDADWRAGRTWSLVYHAGDEHHDLLAEVHRMYAAENGLSPTAFPSLRRMESEVVSMVLDLVRGPDTAGGTMASGGTESIMLAVLAHREADRAEGRDRRRVVVPTTAHPAFRRACHYFDLEVVAAPIGPDYRADVHAIEELAAAEDTLLIAASAPCFPYGVVDPIGELGALALDRGVGLHIDGCLGGFVLSMARRWGRTVPDFDFSVPGVSSISVDLHKYGYGPKGTSTVLYRDRALRRHQYFVDPAWPGGALASPTMVGTRPGGALAGAWAALMALGEDGYRRLYESVLDTAGTLMRGIEAIDHLHVLGEPAMSVFAFGSDAFSIHDVGDHLAAEGWRMDRQQDPDCLHLIVNPGHATVADRFLDDLAAACRSAEAEPGPTDRGAVLYGVTSDVAQGADVDATLRDFIDHSYEI